MDKREFRERLAEGTLTRRQVATALASAGVVFMTLPLVTRRARAAGDITYFTWSEYELPELHQAYIDKYGSSPEVSFFGEEEEALQKLRSGFTPDVTHPCTYSVGRWRDALYQAGLDRYRRPDGRSAGRGPLADRCLSKLMLPCTGDGI